MLNSEDILFYILEDLTEKWDKTEEDLIHMASASVLPLSVYYRGTHKGSSFRIADNARQHLPEYANSHLAEYADYLLFFRLHPKDAYRFLAPRCEVNIAELLGCDGKGLLLCALPGEARISRENLAVLADDVAFMEKKHPELVVRGITPPSLPHSLSPEKDRFKDPMECLDPQRTCYAPKLAAGVEAWRAVSKEPLPRNMTPKKALDAWLRGNADRFEGLIKDDGTPNEQGIEEISKVANWSPKGAPKTPER